ncbi:related to membrane protein [Phialocephala subalpina]|uniref:Related to membrane protein n=1 Tax=Phialocephala subalpina TaxID=576137 RepID=A0A1L7XEV3_9HELO|nr:related to membrane protein [Phialocephala subalpina]
MAFVLQNMLSVTEDKLTVQEALSGVFGSVSLATWIFLLIPQLYLNFKTGKAEGISMGFLFIWLVGDATNLAGALWADLVPTVIALAFYFCLADFVLISQCLYYNHINSKARQASVDTTSSTATEDSPLLTRRRSSDTIGLPGSHRRASSGVSGMSGRRDSLAKILEQDEEETNPWLYNALSILGVVVVGAAGWAIAWQSGVWMPTPEDGAGLVEPAKTALGAKILGYASAVCYLGARIPQIVKNYKDKSCEGLALLFFLLSLMGNATYGASILCHSVERDYINTNLPWLIGSLGTMVEDAIIFVQFRMYSPKKTTSAVE